MSEMKGGHANGHAFMTACPSYEALYVLSWMPCVCLYVMLSDSFICDVIRLLEHVVVCVTVCSSQKRMFRIFALVCGSTSLCVLVCAVVFLNLRVVEC